MKNQLLAAFFAISAICSAQSIPNTSDEFVGPFASWTNVKTAFGAAGDGSTDDTAAIQNALNAFKTNNSVSPILYFPAGTYKITNGLTLAHMINVGIIGASNATTTILWAGSSGGTMLDLNGVAYSKFSRLTFNCASSASYGVDQSWDGTGNYFDTGNEYSDIVWEDCAIPYRCGFLGYGCAESSLERDQFLRATVAGIALYNFNALDIWVWYSTFDTCALGISNYTAGAGAGNFHAYGNNFLHTIGSDMQIGNTGVFSARGNYSIGAAYFINGVFTGNPALWSIQKNTILDTKNDTSIIQGNEGPGLFMDNVIRSRVGSSIGNPVVTWVSYPDATATFIGNTYGNGNTLAQELNVTTFTETNDVVVARSTINPSQPILPPELPNVGRTVIEVSRGANAATIQTAINSAAALNGMRPVVHIPYGSYAITSTISVPVCDLQIIGDGLGDVQGSILNWVGPGPGPVFAVAGPSRVTFRDLAINGNGTGDGIVIGNADQAGGRIYSDQIYLAAGANTQKNLSVNGLDNAFLEFENYQQTGQFSYCTGGPNKRSGSAAGRVDIFSGASYGGSGQFDVTSGCTFLVRDLWYESGAGPGFANIHGKNTFTLDGARVSSSGTPQPFNIVELNGLATITEADVDEGFAISGDGSNAQVLAIGDVSGMTSGSYFVDTTSPAATALLLNSRNHVSPKTDYATVSTANVGTATSPFMITMFAQTRAEMPAVLTALSTSLSDVRMFRVRVYNGINNFTINAGNGLPCDLNQDGVANVVDVQLAVNVALGLNPQLAVSADINGDGVVNVIDVQRVVNSALGGVCKVGP